MRSTSFSRTRKFADEARHLIDQITKLNAGFESSCVAFFGVTSSQGGTILSLPVKDTLTMNELSNLVGVDNSTMTRMVNQLVDKSLVFRQADKKDRRLVCVGLTPEGQKLHEELADALENFYRDSLDSIKAEERAVIIESLKKLDSALTNGLENRRKDASVTKGDDSSSP